MYAFGYTTDYSTPIYSQFGSYLRLLRQVRFRLKIRTSRSEWQIFVRSVEI